MSVVGCVFLGTPFQGTKSQHKASLLAEMAQMVGFGMNSGLVKLLEEDSETLKDLLDDFVALAKEASMRLFCFFEQHESDMMRLISKNVPIKHKEIIVDEDSAKILGYGKASLAADHFELNKFTGPKDGRYVLVSGEISTAVQKAQGILKSRQNAIRQTLIDDGTYQRILDALKVTDPVKDMEDSARGRPASQASWVLSNENYMKWKSGDVSRVLWTHGSAGQGQPVIACSLVRDLSEQMKRDEGVFLAYFFCDEKDSHRRSALDILKLLIRQMILRKRDLTEHLLVDQRKGKKGDPGSQPFDATSVTALWNSLQSMLRDPAVCKVYFIINAFDETDGESREELLGLLNPYLEAQPDEEKNGDESTVKWIILSRSGRPDIEKGLQKAFVIDMNEKENISHVNDAVKTEISGQVDNLAKKKNYNAGLAYFIKRHISSRAEGNYIYVNLVIQELKNLETTQSTNSSIRKFLEGFPYGLTEMFEHIRRRVLSPQSEGIEYTKEILRSLILARRSPTIFELALMADLPLEVHDNGLAIKRYITRCGAFVTVTEDEYETVEWVDVAAKEHLETYAKDQLSLSLNDVQHGIIALRCLDYIRNNTPLQEAREDDEQIPDQDGPDQANIPASNEDGPNFDNTERTTENNAQTKSEETRDDENQGTANRTPNYQTEHDQNNYPFQNQQSHEQVSHSLGYSTQANYNQGYNHRPLVSQEYSDHGFPQTNYPSPPHSQPYDYSSPPNNYAAQNHPAQANSTQNYQAYRPRDSEDGPRAEGSSDSGNQSQEGKNLDDHDPEDLNQTDPNKENQLPDNQHTEVSSNSDGQSVLDVPDEPQSFLHYPSEYWLQHAKQAPADIVEEFNLDDDFWAENSRSRAAWCTTYVSSIGLDGLGDLSTVHIAALSGFLTLLDYLLEHERSNELEKIDSWGFRPFYWACQNGDIYVVQRLVKAGADVNARRRDGNFTALGIAASNSHDEVVRYLLEQGAEVDVQDEEFGTPLYIAAENGCLPIVRQLLEHRANVNLTGGLHRRPLNVAAYFGHLEVVQLLLQKDVDVDPDEDYRYGSALGAASRKGHHDIVRLLLGKGWKVNRKIKIYGSALVAAATYGHSEVVQALLENNLDVTSREQALEIASKNGKIEVVKTLLENSHYLRHQKAFQLAASHGRDDILELLQPHGINPELLNTALYEASDHEHESTVGLLLKFGAHSDAEGQEYGTALTAAAYDGSDGIVQILLENGANVNKQGGSYGNALQAAAFYGDVDIVQKLLDHGAWVNTESIGIYGSALQAACYTGDTQVVELLLARGADVNAEGGKYAYPIIAAADECDVTVVEILVKHGADVNVKGLGDNAPLLVTAGYGLPKETMELLLDHGAAIDATDDRGNTVLITTANSGDTEGLELLLKRGANIHASGDEYGSALHAAALEGNEEVCQLLLTSGADVNQQSGPWSTALQAAAFSPDIDCVKLLLNAGADVNLTGGEYGTALQASSFAGNLECLQAILAAGADPVYQGGEYGCALQAAAAGRDVGCLQALLDSGAEVNQEGGKYNSALQAAASINGNSEIVSALLEHGANVLVDGGLYGSVIQAAAIANDLGAWDMLLAHGADVHARGGKYGNVLQAAALKADDEIIQKLLETPVDVNEVGGKYATALQAASYANRPELVTKLLEHHANVHILGGFYGNALNAAARKGSTRVLSLLLDQSPSDNMLDEGLLQAVYHRQTAVVEMLLKNGANVEARDPVLGSCRDALQRQLEEDPNSDDEGDEDDENSEDSEDDSDDEEEEEEDSDTEEVEDKDASVASLQLGDPGTEESKIQKLLEDAMTKIKRNPSVSRFRSVRRRPISQYQNPDQFGQPVESGHQSYDNPWQAHTGAGYDHYNQQYNGQSQGAPSNSNYRADSYNGQVPQAGDPRRNQYPNTANSQNVGPAYNYQAYGSNQYPPQTQTSPPSQHPSAEQPQAAGYADNRFQAQGSVDPHAYQQFSVDPSQGARPANSVYQAYGGSSGQIPQVQGQASQTYQYPNTGPSQTTGPESHYHGYNSSSSIPQFPDSHSYGNPNLGDQSQGAGARYDSRPPASTYSPQPASSYASTPPASTYSPPPPTSSYHPPPPPASPYIPPASSYTSPPPPPPASSYNSPPPPPPATPYTRPPASSNTGQSGSSDDFARLQAKVSKFSSSMSNFWSK
ncbi:hypothetical protein MMC07_003147 [Pseudocyphellaria aurata]|nr:hypothetical protein [Pseudocyphellaria aurata]